MLCTSRNKTLKLRRRKNFGWKKETRNRRQGRYCRRISAAFLRLSCDDEVTRPCCEKAVGSRLMTDTRSCGFNCARSAISFMLESTTFFAASELHSDERSPLIPFPLAQLNSTWWFGTTTAERGCCQKKKKKKKKKVSKRRKSSERTNK